MKKLYLSIYNGIQAIGWYYMAVLLITTSLSEGIQGLVVISDTLMWLVVRLQLLAFLEVVHVLAGLVPSGILPVLVQVLGRNHVLFAVVYSIPGLQRSAAFFCMLSFWAAIELVRYPFYLCSLWNTTPYLLMWLRYSVFVVLYPVGFSSELWVYFLGWDTIKRGTLHSISLPNAFNFCFYYPWFYIAFLTYAVYMFWGNYKHMFVQRERKLGGNETQSTRERMKVE